MSRIGANVFFSIFFVIARGYQNCHLQQKYFKLNFWLDIKLQFKYGPHVCAFGHPFINQFVIVLDCGVYTIIFSVIYNVLFVSHRASIICWLKSCLSSTVVLYPSHHGLSSYLMTSMVDNGSQSYW